MTGRPGEATGAGGEMPAHGTSARYHLHGCRCAPCTAAAVRYEKQRRLDALSGLARTVDSTGSRRRIQALAVAGFPLRVVAAALGVPVNRLHRTVHGKRMSPAEADAIRALYRRLRRADPAAHGVTADGVAKTRGRARVRGWAGPDAWEGVDIDDPDASPDPPGAYCPRRSYEEIAEDALFVLATVGPMDRAAVAFRLGVHVRTLDRAFAFTQVNAAA